MEPSRTRSTDRGQAIALVVIAVALIAAIAVAMAMIGGRMNDRGRARNAADAAALAGAVDGSAAAAADAAHRNGARLMSFDVDLIGADFVVTVLVQVGGETAAARASTAP